MDEQNADLNQPSGIFGEEKKGFFENFKKLHEFIKRSGI